MARRPALRAGAPAVMALLGALAGCGGPPSDPVRWPADPDSDTPAIDWPHGAPDTSDEWIATLLDYQIAMAVARNTHDYSRPALADRATQDHIAGWAGGAEALASHIEGNPTHYENQPGPFPMVIRDVDAEDDHATISICIPARWATVDGPALGPDDLSDGVPAPHSGNGLIYTLRREPDGHIVVTDSQTHGGCDPDGARAGYFDPPPPYGQTVWADEVIGPDGRPIHDTW